MPLDPQAAAAIETLAAAMPGDFSAVDLNEMRGSEAATVIAGGGGEEPVGAVDDVVIAAEGRDIGARVYTPDGDGTHPLLLFFHGGGWVLGSLDTHDDTCRRLCRRVGAVVASIDYRLAPEHPFPAAAEDCYSALCWVADNAARWGAAADRLALAGDSAGGNLAAVAALMVRERGGPNIRQQTLIYPATDCNFDTDSYRDNATGYFLSAKNMRWCWERYLGEGLEAAADWRASPLRSPRFEGLPPALIISAEYDPLRDDAAVYAERLQNVGVPVTYRCFDGMIHGFVGLHMLIDRAEEAWRLMEDELRRALH